MDNGRIQRAEDSLIAYKNRIEKFLATYLTAKVSVFKEVEPLGEEAGRLLEDFILDGGKRIRAAFTYYGYCAVNDSCSSGRAVCKAALACNAACSHFLSGF